MGKQSIIVLGVLLVILCLSHVTLCEKQNDKDKTLQDSWTGSTNDIMKNKHMTTTRSPVGDSGELNHNDGNDDDYDEGDDEDDDDDVDDEEEEDDDDDDGDDDDDNDDDDDTDRSQHDKKNSKRREVNEGQYPAVFYGIICASAVLCINILIIIGMICRKMLKKGDKNSKKSKKDKKSSKEEYKYDYKPVDKSGMAEEGKEPE